eukprot:scaffold3686_cov193-Alexandrium_tamarense.AAC.20
MSTAARKDRPAVGERRGRPREFYLATQTKQQAQTRFCCDEELNRATNREEAVFVAARDDCAIQPSPSEDANLIQRLLNRGEFSGD